MRSTHTHGQASGQRWAMAAAASLGLILPIGTNGCDDKPAGPQAQGQPTTTAAATSTASADSPETVWQRTCARCHSRDSMTGRSAAEIRAALRDVPSMRRYSDRLTDADLEGLAGLLAGGTAAVAPSPKQADGGASYQYLGAERCVECHQQQVRQWRHSLHAQAHRETVYDYYFIKASQDSKQKLETFCARCHTPIGVRQGSIPFAKPPKGPGDTKVSAVASEGLGCDFCHTISGHDKLENGGFILEPGETKRGPYADSSSSFHQTAEDANYRKSEYCGTCHNVNHPENGIALESTFTEWKESPYAAEGVSCQDCHMTAGLTHRKAQPGTAALEGKDRDHVSSHMFVGPNVLFASSPAAEELRKLSLEMMQKAGTVEIGAIDGAGAKRTLSIMVSNTGAGHYLPTGVTEIREMWLEVTITDSAGKVRLHSGALDKRGDLDPKAIVYRTDVKNAAGEITSQFWNTVAKVRDHRIPPRKTLTEKLELPADLKGELKVSAALRYRSVTPAGLREVGAPADLVKIPVLTIASAEETVKAP